MNFIKGFLIGVSSIFIPTFIMIIVNAPTWGIVGVAIICSYVFVMGCIILLAIKEKNG